MPGIKVLIVGEAKESGRLVSYHRAFARLGHSVEILDTDRYYRIGMANRVGNRLRRVPVYRGGREVNAQVLSHAREFSPDLIFFIKPVLFSPITILALKADNRSVVSWFTDDIFFPANSSRDFYEAIPFFDCHFTTKTHNVQELLEHRAKQAVLLPHAVDRSYHHPIAPNREQRERLGADIVFVGTYADDRRVEYLEKLCASGYRVKVFGGLWHKLSGKSVLHRSGAIQARPVYGSEFSLAMNSSRIALGFLRKHNRDQQTARTYEIPACGGFLLHERTAEANAIFKEGVEAEYFDSYEELRGKVDFYLGHPEKRAEIVGNGFRRATKPDLSYECRVEQILAVSVKILCAA